jgi:MinD superfamily P-loop ATPase
MDARCMKCKSQQKMNDVLMTKTTRGGYMAKGKCSVCGCGMCKIMSETDALKAISSGEAKKSF